MQRKTPSNGTTVARKLSKSQKAKKAQQNQTKAQSRRKFLLLPVAAVAIGGTAFGLNALEMTKREMHDLSVIGNGTPAVVQIHDPSCPTCRRLKSIMKNTIDSDDPINYRLADITTPEGKSLQEKHNAVKITLLYFDAKGRHVHTTQGIQTSDEIKSTVENLFGTQS